MEESEEEEVVFVGTSPAPTGRYPGRKRQQVDRYENKELLEKLSKSTKKKGSPTRTTANQNSRTPDLHSTKTPPRRGGGGGEETKTPARRGGGGGSETSCVSKTPGSRKGEMVVYCEKPPEKHSTPSATLFTPDFPVTKRPSTGRIETKPSSRNGKVVLHFEEDPKAVVPAERHDDQSGGGDTTTTATLEDEETTVEDGITVVPNNTETTKIISGVDVVVSSTPGRVERSPGGGTEQRQSRILIKLAELGVEKEVSKCELCQLSGFSHNTKSKSFLEAKRLLITKGFLLEREVGVGKFYRLSEAGRKLAASTPNRDGGGSTSSGHGKGVAAAARLGGDRTYPPGKGGKVHYFEEVVSRTSIETKEVAVGGVSYFATTPGKDSNLSAEGASRKRKPTGFYRDEQEAGNRCKRKTPPAGAELPLRLLRGMAERGLEVEFPNQELYKFSGFTYQNSKAYTRAKQLLITRGFLEEIPSESKHKRYRLTEAGLKAATNNTLSREEGWTDSEQDEDATETSGREDQRYSRSRKGNKGNYCEDVDASTEIVDICSGDDEDDGNPRIHSTICTGEAGDSERYPSRKRQQLGFYSEEQGQEVCTGRSSSLKEATHKSVTVQSKGRSRDGKKKSCSAKATVVEVLLRLLKNMAEGCSTKEVSATKLCQLSECGFPSKTYYEARQRLIAKGFLEETKLSVSKFYRLTEAGVKAATSNFTSEEGYTDSEQEDEDFAIHNHSINATGGGGGNGETYSAREGDEGLSSSESNDSVGDTSDYSVASNSGKEPKNTTGEGGRRYQSEEVSTNTETKDTPGCNSDGGTVGAGLGDERYPSRKRQKVDMYSEDLALQGQQVQTKKRQSGTVRKGVPTKTKSAKVGASPKKSPSASAVEDAEQRILVTMAERAPFGVIEFDHDDIVKFAGCRFPNERFSKAKEALVTKNLLEESGQGTFLLTEEGLKASPPITKKQYIEGTWTKEENEALLSGIQLYGKDWKMVCARVKHRSPAVIKANAQKIFGPFENIDKALKSGDVAKFAAQLQWKPAPKGPKTSSHRKRAKSSVNSSEPPLVKKRPVIKLKDVKPPVPSRIERLGDPDMGMCLVYAPSEEHIAVTLLKQIHQELRDPQVKREFLNWTIKHQEDTTGEKPESCRSIQGGRLEIFLDATGKSSEAFDEIIGKKLPQNAKQVVLDYAQHQANQDPRLKEGYNYENFSLLVSLNRSPEQAPHLDLVHPNYQFGISLSDNTAGTLFVEDQGDSVKTVEDLEKLWNQNPAPGDDPTEGMPPHIKKALEEDDGAQQLLNYFGDTLPDEDYLRRSMISRNKLPAGTLSSLPGSVVHAGPSSMGMRAILFFSGTPQDTSTVDPYLPDSQYNGVTLMGHLLSILWRRDNIVTKERHYLLRRLVQYIEGTSAKEVYALFGDGRLKDFVTAIINEDYGEDNEGNALSKEEFLREQSLEVEMSYGNDPFSITNNKVDVDKMKCISCFNLFTMWEGKELPILVYRMGLNRKIVIRYITEGKEAECPDEYEGHRQEENLRLEWYEGQTGKFDGSNGRILDTDGDVIEIYKGSRIGREWPSRYLGR